MVQPDSNHVRGVCRVGGIRSNLVMYHVQHASKQVEPIAARISLRGVRTKLNSVVGIVYKGMSFQRVLSGALSKIRLAPKEFKKVQCIRVVCNT